MKSLKTIDYNTRSRKSRKQLKLLKPKEDNNSNKRTTASATARCHRHTGNSRSSRSSKSSRNNNTRAVVGNSSKSKISRNNKTGAVGGGGRGKKMINWKKSPNISVRYNRTFRGRKDNPPPYQRCNCPNEYDVPHFQPKPINISKTPILDWKKNRLFQIRTEFNRIKKQQILDDLEYERKLPKFVTGWRNR